MSHKTSSQQTRFGVVLTAHGVRPNIDPALVQAMFRGGVARGRAAAMSIAETITERVRDVV